MSGAGDGDDGFLARWSRRKRSEGEERAPAGGEPPAEAEALRPAPPAAERPDAEILEELGLPDPATLGPGDDFSAFMARAVPERLRQRALRRLWASNPVLANLDGLLDYGEDFTDATLVVADLATAYRVGQGMPRPAPPEAEPCAEADGAAGGGAETAEVAEAEDRPDTPTPGGPDPADTPGLEGAPGGPAPAPAATEPLAPASPRRMRFTVAAGPAGAEKG